MTKTTQLGGGVDCSSGVVGDRCVSAMLGYSSWYRAEHFENAGPRWASDAAQQQRRSNTHTTKNRILINFTTNLWSDYCQTWSQGAILCRNLSADGGPIQRKIFEESNDDTVCDSISVRMSLNIFLLLKDNTHNIFCSLILSLQPFVQIKKTFSFPVSFSREWHTIVKKIKFK